MDDRPFTLDEIEYAISQGREGSSPGLDGITLPMLKCLFRSHPGFFLFIFNSALKLGYFPQLWRKGRVIFIPKPGRPPEHTSSYRPIVMNSLFGKILERLLNSRLYFFLFSHGLLHGHQFGFTHGRSAVMALYALRQRLAEYKQQKVPAIIVAIDFKGAFDSVWHPLVLHSLQKYYLLRSILRDRSILYRSQSGEASARPTLESLQGSPLSPLLWNLVIRGLLDLPVPHGVVIQAYADTLLSSFRAKTVQQSSALLRRC